MRDPGNEVGYTYHSQEMTPSELHHHCFQPQRTKRIPPADIPPFQRHPSPYPLPSQLRWAPSLIRGHCEYWFRTKLKVMVINRKKKTLNGRNVRTVEPYLGANLEEIGSGRLKEGDSS